MNTGIYSFEDYIEVCNVICFESGERRYNAAGLLLLFIYRCEFTPEKKPMWCTWNLSNMEKDIINILRQYDVRIKIF